jgi:hypothetical protein
MRTTAADGQLAEPAAQPEYGRDLDCPVVLHPLTYLDEGAEVTVGRSDIDSYCVLPADGAALLRELEQAKPPRAVQDWYAATYGETVDVAEFLAAMDEFGFLVGVGEQRADARQVRWQRLGRALFSPLAWVGYLGLVLAAAVLMLREPSLAPHYRNLFFTPYMTVLELVLFLGQFPLLLLHEGFHALAGRRLGLRSRLGLGRRLYFLVFETALDGLVTVPRRKRYLPMLAGMLADLLVIAALTVVAAALRRPDGTLPVAGGVCLALAFGAVLRFIWQFYLYLQTDLYHVVVTVLGCVDLQTTARRMVRNRLNRILGRRAKVLDESTWHPRDRAVARWYSWLMVAGYAVSVGTLVVAALPTMVRVLGQVFGRLLPGSTAGLAGLADSVVFLVLNLGQLAIIGAVVARERQQRRTAVTAHVID